MTFKIGGKPFAQYNDPNGNPLIGLNKDGSIYMQSILFSDGTSQNTAGGGSSINFSDAEVPTGTINGSNTAFTLGHTPNPSASLICVSDGIVLKGGGVGFTLSLASLTLVSAPVTSLVVWYRY